MQISHPRLIHMSGDYPMTEYPVKVRLVHACRSDADCVHDSIPSEQLLLLQRQLWICSSVVKKEDNKIQEWSYGIPNSCCQLNRGRPARTKLATRPRGPAAPRPNGPGHTHGEVAKGDISNGFLAPTSIPGNLSESSETLEHSEVQVLGLAWCHTVENCRYVGVISSHITGVLELPVAPC